MDPFEGAMRSLFRKFVPICMDGFPKVAYQEPDYSAGLTLGLAKQIECFMNLIRSAWEYPIRFGASYIHQSPVVSYADGRVVTRRELGDVLFLYRDLTEEGKGCCRATLMQLKMDNLDHVDQSQYRLYTEWPSFCLGRKYVDKTAYRVESNKNKYSAMYTKVVRSPLLFEVNEPTSSEVQFSEWGNVEDFLTALTLGRVGREIGTVEAHIQDEWSRLIWDVVERHRNVHFRRKNIAVGNRVTFPRQNGTFFDSMSFLRGDALMAAYEDTKINIGCPLIEEENIGVPGILLIERLPRES